MTTPLTNPHRVAVYGPEAGYTVTITGASVFADPEGTPVTMPVTVPASVTSGVGVVAGISTFWVDHARGASLSLAVKVHAIDGTVLLDRYGIHSVPVVVDAVTGQVSYSDALSGE